MFKNRGEGFLGKGGNSQEGGGISRKKCKRHKCHSKMNLSEKFHPNKGKLEMDLLNDD